MMTWKQIETSREVRMWIKDIVLPGATTFVALCCMFPNLWTATKTKTSNGFNKIKSKFKKEEGPA